MTTTQIGKSVGASASNQHDDVVIVQQLLNKFIEANQMSLDPLVLDGDCGPLTKQAIGTFQMLFLGHKHPDRRVDRNGQTLAALNDSVYQKQKGDPHDSTQKSVIQVLRDPRIQKVHFTLDGFTVTNADFSAVANRFESHHLRAYHVPTLGDNATYVHKNEEESRGHMLVGFPVAATSTQQSIVLHEATHAVCDRRGEMMMVDRAEAIAHLAQAIFYYALTRRHLTVNHAGTTDVLSHCGNIAILFLTENRTIVSQGESQRLFELIRRLPTVTANSGFFYDGI